MQKVYGHANEKLKKEHSWISDDDDDDYENVSGLSKGPTIPSRSGTESAARRNELALKSLEFSSPAVNEVFRDITDTEDCKRPNTQERHTLILFIVSVSVFLIGTIIASLMFVYYNRITAEMLELKKNVSQVQMMSNTQQEGLKGELKSVNKVSQGQETAKSECDGLKEALRDINRTFVKEQDSIISEVRNIKNKLENLCPPGWNLLGFYCYFLSITPLKWEESKNDCIKREGAFLILTGTKEMDVLKQLLGNKRYWIGLKRDTNIWKWVDGTPMTFSNWHVNEPNNHKYNEHCTEIVSGAWNDLDCNNKIDYICKRMWSY